MRKNLRILRGEQRVLFRGENKERFLNACAQEGIALWSVEIAAEGLRASLYEDDWPLAERLAQLCTGELDRETLRGGSTERALLRRRRGLGLLSALAALTLSFSGLFIWDFRVEGNEKLSDTVILRTLAACGVEEGCFWPASDAEAVRSEMLLRLPELAWMSLNVRGSRASVVVLERKDKPEIYLESEAADLIAAKDGVVSELSVKNGKPLVRPGQTVTAGETLVSGTMDSPTAAPREVRAAGGVLAHTWPEKKILLCPGARRKDANKGFHLILGLRVGKGRVNLLSKGRKELDECDRIVKEYRMGAEGVFAFPIRLIAEVYRPYSVGEEYRADPALFRERARQRLAEETDGEILSAEFVSEDGALLLKAHCLENIASTKEIS